MTELENKFLYLPAAIRIQILVDLGLWETGDDVHRLVWKGTLEKRARAAGKYLELCFEVDRESRDLTKQKFQQVHEALNRIRNGEAQEPAVIVHDHGHGHKSVEIRSSLVPKK